ncbi:zf-HC2 domain-containing protein [Dactylosporangium sp. NBC_01737]|uniref:zf-HC2 domain-containing protein n=1 Tax=Dactylosporangium sp. NBC_01737 TaxID=2975959 RepID=UPI002E148E71|nr:zf-HC2 domain-containing protein [Dactylosporangium sp. NBC_01737]
MTAEQGDGHVRLQLGAYVLGALPADEELAVTQHLAECSQCADIATDLTDVRRVLDRLDGSGVARLLEAVAAPPISPAPTHSVPAQAGPTQAGLALPSPARPAADSPGKSAPPPGRPPGGPRRRRARPTRVVVSAVALALAVGISIGAWLGAKEPVNVRLAGNDTDTQSGVSVSVTVVGEPDGARVEAVVEELTVNQSYRLYALGDRGESQLAVSWTAQNRVHSVGGNVTIPINRITAVTLFRANDTANDALVTVRLSKP